MFDAELRLRQNNRFPRNFQTINFKAVAQDHVASFVAAPPRARPARILLAFGIELVGTFFDEAFEMIRHAGLGVALRELVVRGA